MEPENPPKINAGSVLVLFGIAIGVALFLTSSYIFHISVHNRTARTITYLLISFPLPVAGFSFFSGYRYGKETRPKVIADLIIMVICISIVFLYAIVQSSPGELGTVIWKAVLFLGIVFTAIFYLAKFAYDLGSRLYSDK